MRVAGGHQAILTLNFMDGTPAYAGEVRNSDKEAQQSAAEQALIAIEPVLALVPEKFRFDVCFHSNSGVA